MPENRLYPPEGLRQSCSYTLKDLLEAKESKTILEGIPIRCDAEHHLHLRFGNVAGLLPRHEVIAPWISGADRDISAISRVGKLTCFTVSDVISDAKGAPKVILSRKSAQNEAMDWFLEHLHPGTILTGQVIRLESYGAFIDIGCGIIGLLPIERISVSRIEHPKDRFLPGQKILAAVLQIDAKLRRITLTHRELLGTWMENASLFRSGETVRGIVRSIKPYGTFVELTPNLSGLAENTDGLQTGDLVSVYIKSIHPENMKIKLQIITRLQPTEFPEPLSYQITDGRLQHWVYSSADTLKSPIQTDFTASGS